MFGFSSYDTNKYTNQPVYFGQKAAGSYTVRGFSRPSIGVYGKKTKVNYYDKNAKDPKIAAMQQQQQAYQQQLQATANASAAANTKQLQSLQRERSAVSKMTQDYTAMLKKEADAKAKAQEEARVSAATSAANQARQGQTANLQIQPASKTEAKGGTSLFKKRLQSKVIAGISGMVNI